MAVFIILYMITVGCGVLQMFPFHDRDKFKWYTIVGYILSIVLTWLLIVCTRVDCPELWLLTLSVWIAVFLMSLYKFGEWFLIPIMFAVFATIAVPSYQLVQLDDDTWAVCGRHTYWITGKVHARGVDPFGEQVVARIGSSEGIPDRHRFVGLHDNEGNIFIPRICGFDENMTRFEIGFYNDDPKSVNVVRLFRADGTSVTRDFTGKDVSSESYTIPTYDDDTTD